MAAERRDDAGRVHTRDERETRAVDRAHEVAAFHQALRARGVSAAAAQSLAETYTAALLAGDGPPPEAWR
jgi:hypothetical protein